MAVVVDERERGDGLVHEKVCFMPSACPVLPSLYRADPNPTCPYMLNPLARFDESRFDEVLTHDGPLLLPSTSPLTQRVSRVCTRLVQALEEEDQTVIHGASWPPKDRVSELSKVIAERERRNSGGVGGGGGSDGRGGTRYEPSAKASSAVMPFRPESANPLKVLEGGDWSLYVVDLVSPALNSTGSLKPRRYDHLTFR